MRSHSTYMRFLHTPKSSTSLISCMSHSRTDLGLKRRPTADGNSGTWIQFLFEEIFRIKTKQTHPPGTHLHVYTNTLVQVSTAMPSKLLLHPSSCCLLQASTPTNSGTPLGVVDLVLVRRILCYFDVYVAPFGSRCPVANLVAQSSSDVCSVSSLDLLP
jgi:hypothetical protein